VAPLPGGFGTSGNEIVLSIPLTVLGTDSGPITDIRAYSALGTPATGPINEMDSLALPDGQLSPPAVDLGLRWVDSADEVAFNTLGSVVQGVFQGTVDTAGMYGGNYEVWARACSADDCGAHFSVTEIDGPPRPRDTSLVFTDPSAAAGQFSDRTRWAALLTAGAPVAGKTVNFTLKSGDTTRTFSAVTDADGIASLTPKLRDIPGDYTLTVNFAGEGELQPSSVAMPFDILRERTISKVRVARRRGLPTLLARLVDHDDTSEGIGGRRFTFFVSGSKIGAGVTDKAGRARLVVPKRYRSGNRWFTIRFVGDAYYLASKDSIRRIS
jgi:hypothetical protein